MADGQPGETNVTRRPREQLLAAVVAELETSGSSDLSLRDLASRVGTSHRMLIYHFGSKAELLVAVAQEVEREQQAALADLGAAAAGGDPREVAEAMWQRTTAPDLADRARLFYELYGQALMGRPGTTQILEGDVDRWVDGAAALLEAQGTDSRQARVDARLSLAVVRGLLLDLLASGDRAAVDAAHARFLDLYEAHRDD
ncbi:hypothetical protein B7486_64840 [cyanobacterium TDX16]|nr:hypothetical protein B7486_64840 [cyanobacterium TDX16]